MDILTRDQAIKRIADIYKDKETSHLHGQTGAEVPNGYLLNDLQYGAISELIAIFNIKEDELRD